MRFNESGYRVFAAKGAMLCATCDRPINRGEDYVVVPGDLESAEKMLRGEAYVGKVAHSRCSGPNPAVIIRTCEEIGSRLAPHFNLDTPEGYGAFQDAVSELLPAAYADFCKEHGWEVPDNLLENWKVLSARRKAQMMKERFPGYYQ